MQIYGPFPPERPAGIRRRSLPAGAELWRIDTAAPRAWRWEGMEAPRSRFDPASGGFRVRYAALTPVGAARERYLDSGLYIPPDHADHHLVRLQATRRLRVVDLRTEATLEALCVDDRISTGHERHVWEACQRLTDAVRVWWPDLDGLLYRSRTTPASSFNVAFFSTAAFTTRARPLRVCQAELDAWVLEHHFTVGFDF